MLELKGKAGKLDSASVSFEYTWGRNKLLPDELRASGLISYKQMSIVNMGITNLHKTFQYKLGCLSVLRSVFCFKAFLCCANVCLPLLVVPSFAVCYSALHLAMFSCFMLSCIFLSDAEILVF